MCKVFVSGYIIKGLRASVVVMHWNIVLFHLELNTIMKDRLEETNIGPTFKFLALKNYFEITFLSHKLTNTEFIYIYI